MIMLQYDRVADALYIRLGSGCVAESVEVADGIIVDFGEDGNVIGIEVLEFSRRKIDLNKLISMSEDEIVPTLVAHSR